jgi:3-dehydroquinate dehydratase-2
LRRTAAIRQTDHLFVPELAVARIWLINGPNLNLLGQREPGLYGAQSLPEIEAALTREALDRGHALRCFQSNHEGALVDQVQQLRGEAEFLLLNPGAYTHSSIALRDALSAVAIPFIEIHLSNVYAREPFRHRSYFSDIAAGCIVGFGPLGYRLALYAACERLAASAA